jgi:hypothetical protein
MASTTAWDEQGREVADTEALRDQQRDVFGGEQNNLLMLLMLMGAGTP